MLRFSLFRMRLLVKSNLTHLHSLYIMDWSQFATMDPHLLLGVVNTELRNHFDSLQALCLYHAIDPIALCQHLAKAGYLYQTQLKQFR